ncbi:MAG: methionyl-tRNA formyltransferase [Candidatus Peribacteraceae bacterium]|nr:methionyl-tRNA formyltransferase [Candidatus Peribacteraceae bacterium]
MPSPLSIVFCGTPGVAVPMLKALAADPAFKILGVVTQPDRATGRKQQLTPSETKAAAEALGLPVVQPEKLNAALPELQARFGQPDFLVVVAYGQILSQAVLDWPRIMPVNVHFSLLPRWRGASPVEHAILSGDTQTGVAVQRMAKALDAGEVLATRVVEIHPEDNALTLRSTLAEAGAALLPETLKGPLTATPQDPAGITTCGILSRADGRGDPATETAEHLFRKLRAFTPWPGLTVVMDGADLKVIAASLEEKPKSVPLPCRDGTVLHLLTVQPASKKPMPAADWARGRR